MKSNPVTEFPTQGLVREKHILAYVNFSHSTLWRRINDGLFPKPMKDGRCTFWFAQDIIDWVNNKGKRLVQNQ